MGHGPSWPAAAPEVNATDPSDPGADVREIGGWCRFRAELELAAGGYAHAAARLWSPAGRLAALSRQAVAIFG